MFKKLRKFVGISYFDLHEEKKKFPTYEEYCQIGSINQSQYALAIYSYLNRNITRHWTIKNPFNDKKIVILKQKIQ
jgi:hypothetical protein